METTEDGPWLLYNDLQQLIDEHARYQEALKKIATNFSWANFVAAHEIAEKALKKNNSSA